ncbi:RND family efflux transporter MFP subunit [Hyphomicrobiales bacterium]|nr:RND family efflux transporter MFP subunit [Hyphomicrobiales bacterium]CAH1698766.1 RND family efflux transporter MFP subunit [Hyphomicrobiales bacterium]CAI0342413.1 membrane fusion protein, multidrug efflux system [Hyphomicrobiales bacterium]
MSAILTRRMPVGRLGWAAAAALLGAALASCGNEPPPPAEARPVGVVSVEAGQFADDIQLSGEIQAKKDVGLAFRIGGRVLERPVNIGDRVAAGQLIARLEPALEQNALAAAKAALEAARGEVSTTRNTFERQERLMAQGFTTRPRFDQAQRAQETAQAQLENAEAQVELARDRLGFTELRADAAGVVTARRIEPGEVVQPGQIVVQIARDDGRDAVFNVPAAILDSHLTDAKIRVRLADAPAVTAYGRVREVAPQADPVTRTFEVRVGLQDPPEAMRLGSTVVGTIELTTAAIVSIPASALTQQGESPAVWIVDPAKSTVSLRNVDILRFDPGTVILSQGLEPGETIVSAGIQALHPGQRVRALPERQPASRQQAAASPP